MQRIVRYTRRVPMSFLFFDFYLVSQRFPLFCAHSLAFFRYKMYLKILNILLSENIQFIKNIYILTQKENVKYDYLKLKYYTE